MSHRSQIIQVPTDSPGTTRCIGVNRIGPEGVGQRIYLQAALHADEVPGVLVLHKLIQELRRLDSRNDLLAEFVIVPAANPIGTSQMLYRTHHVGRVDLVRQENFNRNFPDLLGEDLQAVIEKLGSDAADNVATIRGHMRSRLSATRPTTEVGHLRRTLLDLALEADWVLDFHCDNESVVHLYAGEGLWPEIEPLARHLKAELTLLSWNSGGQCFDEACSVPWWRLRQLAAVDTPVPLACRAVTVELRGQADVDETTAREDVQNLLSFFADIGAVRLHRKLAPALIRAPMPLEGTFALEAPVGGVVVHHASPGQEVVRGEVVAEILDPVTGAFTRLEALDDGVVFSRSRGRLVHAGAEIAKIATRSVCRTGSLLSP